MQNRFRYATEGNWVGDSKTCSPAQERTPARNLPPEEKEFCKRVRVSYFTGKIYWFCVWERDREREKFFMEMVTAEETHTKPVSTQQEAKKTETQPSWAKSGKSERIVSFKSGSVVCCRANTEPTITCSSSSCLLLLSLELSNSTIYKPEMTWTWKWPKPCPDCKHNCLVVFQTTRQRQTPSCCRGRNLGLAWFSPKSPE